MPQTEDLPDAYVWYNIRSPTKQEGCDVTAETTNGSQRPVLGRPRDAGKTQQILDAARTLILQQGINVTIDQISRAAGVSRDAVYRRWPTRRDVVMTVAMQSLSETVPIPDTGSLREDLRRVMTAGAEGLVSGPFGRVIRSLIAEVERDPSWESVLVAAHDGRRSVTSVIVERAVRRGELPANTDGDLLIDMIAGVVWYRVLVVRKQTSSSDLDTLIKRVLRAFVVEAAT
jgi:AcrR family transcriptional regulator